MPEPAAEPTRTSPGTPAAVEAAAEQLRAAVHAAHAPGAGMTYASDVYKLLAELALIGLRAATLVDRTRAAVEHAGVRGWLTTDVGGEPFDTARLRLVVDAARRLGFAADAAQQAISATGGTLIAPSDAGEDAAESGEAR